MTTVSEEKYLQRQTTGTPCKQNVKGKSKAKIYRDWWLVKHGKSERTGVVPMRNIHFSQEYIGKKVRFKMEIMEDAVPKGDEYGS